MYKPKGEEHDAFVKKHYVTCECGYNNAKRRFVLYGTCLRCGKILDKKAYLKRIILDKRRTYGKKVSNYNHVWW